MRYILLVFFTLIGTFASAQVQFLGSPTTTVRNRGNFVSDSLFYLPKRTKAPSDTGAIRYQISDSALYVWTGSAWRTAGTAGSAITGSGVAGYMPEFTTATNIDTTRLYHSNGRFAIGSTTTTNGVFNVYGGNMYADSTTTLSNLFRVDDARRQVGIGTNTPFDEIDIIGRVRIQDTGVAAPNAILQLTLRNSSDGGNQIRYSNSATDDLVSLYGTVEGSGGGTDDGVFRIHTALNGTSSERMRVTSNGEVNIGSSVDAGNYTLQNYGGLYSTASTVLAATSGNIGLGIVPSSWSYAGNVDLGNDNNIFGGTDAIGLGINAVFNSGWKYKGAGRSTFFKQSLGDFQWWNSASGTAGNAITFTQAMTFNTSNELLINTTTDAGAYALQVAGAIYNTTTITTGAPTSGSAKPWRLGEAATVSPTSPNRTIRVEIDGTVYYIHAKTTND